MANHGTLIVERLELSGRRITAGPVVENTGNLTLLTFAGVVNGGGHGVTNSGQLTIAGGHIQQNAGGGVQNSGSLVMSGGVIRGNTAQTGAGVLMSGGAFEMTGGAVLGNTATENGGGVCLSGGSFTLAGGTLTGNSAGTAGGGICLCGGSLSLSAVVSGNQFLPGAAPAHGVDLYVSEAAAAVTLQGGAVLGPVGGLYCAQPPGDVLVIGPAGLFGGASIELENPGGALALPGARVAKKPAGVLTAAEAACFSMPAAQLAGVIAHGGEAGAHVAWESTLPQPPGLTAAQPTYHTGGLAGTSGTLTLTFSKAMDTATAGRVALGSAPLSGGFWQSSQHYAVPYAHLESSRLYTVAVSGFKSADGLAMKADSRFTFTTADMAAPYVVSAEPFGYNAPAAGALALTFNEPMAPAGASLRLFEAATGQPVPIGTPAWANGQTLTAAYSGLAAGTRYRLVLSGCRDLAGNRMAEEERLFTTARTLVAAIRVTGCEDGVLRFIPGGAKTLPVVVTGAGGAAPHNPAVLWSSANTKVAEALPQPGGGTLFRAGVAGSTVLTATSADGNCTARFTMVVAPAEARLMMNIHTILLNGPAAITLESAGLDPLEQYAWLELYDAATLQPYPYDPNTGTHTGAPVHCALRGNTISVTPSVQAAADAGGGVVVVRAVAGTPGFADTRVWDECVVHLPRLPGLTSYQPFHLTAASLTAYALRPEAARLGLRREYAADAAALPLAGCTVRFTEGYAALNSLFAFEVVDDETVAVRVIASDVKSLKSSYKGTLEIVSPGGIAVPVKQALTLKVNKSLPAVKAAAVKLNSFYPGARAAIMPTAAKWDSLRENPAYQAKNDALLRGEKAWLNCEADANGNILALSPKGTAARSGTLYLLAAPTGWGGQTVAVSVKVSTASTAPGVRLKSAKASLYGDSRFSAGAALTLCPKRKGDTLAGLGVASVSVVPQAEVAENRQARYPNQALYTVHSFDLHSGGFTLAAAEGAAPANGRVLLQVRFGNTETGPASQLEVTVKVVPAGTKVGLKTGKSAITLSPAAAESARLPVATTIPGFDVAAFGGLTCEVLNPKGHVAPAARIENGDTLVLEAPVNATAGQSYRLILTLPGVNAGLKGGPNATLTLTVKTAASKNRPAAKLSVKGSASLTTAGAATVTIKLQNYGGGLGAEPVFEYQARKTGQPVPAHAFTAVNTAPGKWAVRPVAGSGLAPGGYRLRLAGWAGASGIAFGPSGWVNFTVSAPKSKVTQSAKTVMLYAAEPQSRATVALSLPAGCPEPDAIKARGATAPFRVDAWPGGCVIRFAEGQPAGKVKARTLTIDLYAGGLPVGTATVKVTAQNI